MLVILFNSFRALNPTRGEYKLYLFPANISKEFFNYPCIITITSEHAPVYISNKSWLAFSSISNNF